MCLSISAVQLVPGDPAFPDRRRFAAAIHSENLPPSVTFHLVAWHRAGPCPIRYLRRSQQNTARTCCPTSTGRQDVHPRIVHEHSGYNRRSRTSRCHRLLAVRCHPPLTHLPWRPTFSLARPRASPVTRKIAISFACFQTFAAGGGPNSLTAPYNRPGDRYVRYFYFNVRSTTRARPRERHHSISGQLPQPKKSDQRRTNPHLAENTTTSESALNCTRNPHRKKSHQRRTNPHLAENTTTSESTPNRTRNSPREIPARSTLISLKTQPLLNPPPTARNSTPRIPSTDRTHLAEQPLLIPPQPPRTAPPQNSHQRSNPYLAQNKRPPPPISLP